MTPLVVRAPGKLVLVGEYAVLDGAGAVVAAVDRGVECSVEAGEGIATPGDDRYVRAALLGAPRNFYRFSDWNPVRSINGKPGFGGSAAATVAATIAAGFARERAFAVHAEVQGGGSGVDVHASLAGGVTTFPGGAPVACPPMIAVWSGESAATGPRVVTYRAWVPRDAFVAASEGLVRAFASDPIGVLTDAYVRLREMAAAAGIVYDTPAHAQIHALARSCGGSAKPSGAGGGDIAVALFPDEDRRAAFVRACEGAGLTTIPVVVSPGAR